MVSTYLMAHHIKALPPVLKAMQEPGFTARHCLEGTGVSEADLLARVSKSGGFVDKVRHKNSFCELNSFEEAHV